MNRNPLGERALVCAGFAIVGFLAAAHYFHRDRTVIENNDPTVDRLTGEISRLKHQIFVLDHRPKPPASALTPHPGRNDSEVASFRPRHENASSLPVDHRLSNPSSFGRIASLEPRRRVEGPAPLIPPAPVATQAYQQPDSPDVDRDEAEANESKVKAEHAFAAKQEAEAMEQIKRSAEQGKKLGDEGFQRAEDALKRMQQSIKHTLGH